MDITYSKIGDYLIPNLVAENTNEKENLGKYAHLRLDYLKNNNRAIYIIFLMENELTNHLLEIQEIATERVELIIKELAEKENITEELKANDQMKWVGLMNNIRNIADEIILKELIYI